MAGIGKNLFYNTALTVSQMLIPLLTFPYVTRILLPSGIGKIAFVDSIVQYAILLAALGIPVYGVREVAKVRENPQALSRLYTELLSIHLLLTVIISVAYTVAFLCIPKLQDSSTLFFIGLGIMCFSVFPTEWLFQGMEQTEYIAKRTILVRVLSVIAIFLTVKSRSDINWYYAISLLILICNSVINLFMASRMVKIVAVNLNFKRHFSPLFYIFSGSMAISVYLVMDSIILGFLTDETEVGYYSTAIKISKIFISLVTALSVVVIPRLSTSFSSGNHNEARDLLAKCFDYMILITVPLMTGLYLTAPSVVHLLAGEAFYPAIQTVRILSPMVFIIGMASIFAYQILIPMGKERIYLIAVTIGMIFSITVNFILIPYYKHNGAALTSITTEVLVAFLSLYLSLKIFRFKIPIMKFIKALIACVIFFPIVSTVDLLTPSVIIRLAAVVPLCAIAYLLIQYFFWKNQILLNFFSLLRSKLRRPS